MGITAALQTHGAGPWTINELLPEPVSCGPSGFASFLQIVSDGLGAIAAVALVEDPAAPRSAVFVHVGGAEFSPADWAQLEALAESPPAPGLARPDADCTTVALGDRPRSVSRIDLPGRLAPATALLVFANRRAASFDGPQRRANPAPLLAAGYRLWHAQRQAEEEAAALVRSLETLQTGVMIVDRGGAVGHANAEARRLLGNGATLGALLRSSEIDDRIALQVAVRHACEALAATDRDGEATQAATIVHVRRRGCDAPIALAVVAGANEAILLASDPIHSNEEEMRAVCKLCDLSPMESELARMITEGISLKEAAARLRIKEQTARSYLKQIFLKTDTRRQAELVHFLMSRLVHVRMPAQGTLAEASRAA